MLYIVSYLNSQGAASSLKIEAENREEARWASKIPERRILSVREDVVGRLASIIEAPRPDAKNQAVFMQTLSSALSSGRTIKQAVENLLEVNQWIKFKEKRLGQCEGLVDYFELFRFDRFAVLMAKAAEKNGQFSQGLRQSSKYLLEKEKISTEVGTELRMGIIYIILGLGFFITIPTFIGPTLEKMIGGAHSIMRPNDFTWILIYLGRFIREYGYLFLLAPPLVFFYKKTILRLTNRLPLFNLFYQKRLLDRSTQFLAVYKMLHESGFVDSEIIYELVSSTRGEDRDVYSRIYAHLATSDDLETAFDKEDWSAVIRDGMSVINQVDQTEQKHILQTMEETIHLQNIHAARNVSKALSRIGFVLMMASVLAAVLGFYLPLASGASGFGH